MPLKTHLPSRHASQLKITAGWALFADTNSTISQTNAPPPWACQALSLVHPFSPQGASWSAGRWQHLRMFPRAASCCTHPDVSDDGKRANEAAEDCTPHFFSPLHAPTFLATQLLGQMCDQKGAGFTAVKLPRHGHGGYWNTEVWLELNGLHWLPWVLFSFYKAWEEPSK